MKSHQNRILCGFKAVALAAVALAFSSCGKIPEGYRGKFRDTATGTQVTLNMASGALAFPSGRLIESDASDADFEDLLESKPGIYVRPHAEKPDLVEVFWFNPKPQTRKEESGFVWLEAEVLYSRMNSKDEDKVQQFKMIHCENGMVLLDLPSKTWNGGCPADPIEYDFVRQE